MPKFKPEIAVTSVQGLGRVHTEFYRSEHAENTIILVNGSLATTASFTQTLKNLHPHLNVVMYDQPYAGRSKPHNPHPTLLTQEMEAQVLLELVERFDANCVMSFSWGGIAALTALSHAPKRIEKAVISSFSPLINGPMRDYLEHCRRWLADRNRIQLGNLVNNTLGKHLPPLFKRYNFRHVSTLADHEYAQMHFHIAPVLNSDPQSILKATRDIDIPVLFINGEWDEYTKACDVQRFAQSLRKSQFLRLENTGHFLDMEHKMARRKSQLALLDFLKPSYLARTTPLCQLTGWNNATNCVFSE